MAGAPATSCAPYEFVILEGMRHWLPEQAPEQVLPLLRKHVAAHSG